MKMLLLSTCTSFLLNFSIQAQTAEERRVDSIRNIIQKRYDEISVKYNLRNLDTMLAFRTKDFRVYGPSGELQDYPMGVDNAKYFLTNNIPPYNIRNTILSIRVSPNNLFAVVDVQQESVRKRELAGKLRDVKVMVDQTETWVNQNGKWLIQSVENLHNRKRYVDGKRVSDDPNAPYNPNAPEWVDPLEQAAANTAPVYGTKMPPGRDAVVATLVDAQCKIMMQAYAKKDMLAIARFYADDAVIASGRSTISGRKAIDQFWRNLRVLGRSWTLATNSIEVHNDLALLDGYAIARSVQGGKEVELKTRFLMVWKQQKDGSWKIARDYYSAY
jgi:ketosteroid isomerase-like protein